MTTTPRGVGRRRRCPRCGGRRSRSARRRCWPGPSPRAGRPDGPSRLSLDFANQEIASATARGQLAYYELLERRGLLRMIRTGRRPRRPLAELAGRRRDATPIGYILAMEGADPIVDAEPGRRAWWDLGLRSVNLAHYGKSRYAVGTGDDGPLTPGRRPAPQGVRAARHDPRRDPPLRHQLLPGARRLRRPGAGQPQQLPGPGPRRPAVQRRADPPPDRARRRHRRGPRRLDARTPAGSGARPRARWSGSTPWPTTSTTSASSPATPATPRSAATSTAASAPSRSPPGWTGSPTSRSWTRSSPRRGYPPSDIDAIFHGNWLRFFREHLPR